MMLIRFLVKLRVRISKFCHPETKAGWLFSPLTWSYWRSVFFSQSRVSCSTWMSEIKPIRSPLWWGHQAPSSCCPTSLVDLLPVANIYFSLGCKFSPCWSHDTALSHWNEPQRHFFYFLSLFAFYTAATFYGRLADQPSNRQPSSVSADFTVAFLRCMQILNMLMRVQTCFPLCGIWQEVMDRGKITG